MEWRDIPNWDGKYKVNTVGQIKSKRRNHLMTPHPDKNGYLIVHLRYGTRGEKSTSYRVHRAVALAFIPNPDDKPEVNHKNGRKDDNRVENLEWTTTKENHHHARSLGLREYVYNHMPVEQIDRKTGEVVARYNSQSDAGKALGICDTGISMVIHGKRPTAGGYYWRTFND